MIGIPWLPKILRYLKMYLSTLRGNNSAIFLSATLLNGSMLLKLTLKAPITTAADDNHKYFSLFFRENRFDVSSESSAGQRIHMKNQALFSSKDKSKKLKCRLLQSLYGALWVKTSFSSQSVFFFLSEYAPICNAWKEGTNLFSLKAGKN